MTKPPRGSPLITRAFRKAGRRSTWSDGLPLFAAQAAELAYACVWPVRPPDGLPDAPPALTARIAAAADDRGPRIHAMRQAGMSWQAIRLALGYGSLSGATNCYHRWTIATETERVSNRDALAAAADRREALL